MNKPVLRLLAGLMLTPLYVIFLPAIGYVLCLYEFTLWACKKLYPLFLTSSYKDEGKE